MKIAVSSAGSATGMNIISSLKDEYGIDLTVIGCDINPKHLVASSVISDDFYVLPPANDKKYTEKVLEFINDFEIDYFWPVMDYEMHKLAEELSDDIFNEKIISVSQEAILLVKDKKYWSEYLSEYDFIPFCVNNIDELDKATEWFVKPKTGVGSRGARLMKTSQLKLQFNEIIKENIIQEVLCNPEITIDAFYLESDSYVASVSRERVEVKSGVCSKARLFCDDSLNSLSETLAKALKINGSYCFQVMLSSVDNCYKVIDINPRTGGATSMSKKVNNNFVNAHFSYLTKGDYRKHLNTEFSETFVVRTFSDIVTG